MVNINKEKLTAKMNTIKELLGSSSRINLDGVSEGKEPMKKETQSSDSNNSK